MKSTWIIYKTIFFSIFFIQWKWITVIVILQATLYTWALSTHWNGTRQLYDTIFFVPIHNSNYFQMNLNRKMFEINRVVIFVHDSNDSLLVLGSWCKYKIIIFGAKYFFSNNFYSIYGRKKYSFKLRKQLRRNVKQNWCVFGYVWSKTMVICGITENSSFQPFSLFLFSEFFRWPTSTFIQIAFVACKCYKIYETLFFCLDSFEYPCSHNIYWVQQCIVSFFFGWNNFFVLLFPPNR